MVPQPILSSSAERKVSKTKLQTNADPATT